MGYDDVIKQKQDIVDGLIKNIGEYKIQIESYKNQTRVALAELNYAKNQKDDYLTIQSGKKIQLDNQIVALQNQVQELTEASAEANKNSVEHYKFLEGELIKEYQSRGYELDQHNKFLDLRESSLAARENDLTQRASIAQQTIDRHTVTVKDFDRRVSDIENKHRKSVGDLAFNKKTFEEKMIDLDMRELASDARERRISDREAKVSEREVAPAAILSRIDEANRLMAEAQQLKEELNKSNIEIKAKQALMIQKEIILNSREVDLDKRDANLKILEAAKNEEGSI